MKDGSAWDALIQNEQDRRWMSVQNWMWTGGATVRPDQTMTEAARVLKERKLEFLPVADEKGRPVGLITLHHILEAFLDEDSIDPLVGEAGSDAAAEISLETKLTDLVSLDSDIFFVVDEKGILSGVLTKKDIFNGLTRLVESYMKNERTSAILNVILEKAYEGIAVVDEKGILIEFNEAYSKFTGIARSEAIGRHVTEVIENTNLHETVRQGIPERGVLQNIQGQDMVVHRIPLWRDGRVIAAIGMLIFEGVSEVYRIYERLQLQQIMTSQEPPVKIHESISSLDQIIGTSESLSNLKRLARKAARTDDPVLLAGEKGTGKKSIAEGIHQLSVRSSGPFTAIRCAELTEQEAERLLFNDRELKEGTVYLEGIDQLEPVLQKKLRDATVRGLNTRINASTASDLQEEMLEGRFDRDLAQLLTAYRIDLPPLRNRREDIPFLLSHYMREICFNLKIPEKALSPASVGYLMNYRWEGNVEELISVIRQLVTSTEVMTIRHEDLPDRILADPAFPSSHGGTMIEQIKGKTDEEEKNTILSLLRKTGGNKSKTADLLGIHRTTLYKKLKKHNILT